MITAIDTIPTLSDEYSWTENEPGNRSVYGVDSDVPTPGFDYVAQNYHALTTIHIDHHYTSLSASPWELISKSTSLAYLPARSGLKKTKFYVGNRERIDVFDETSSIIEVPGHTLDHSAYYYSFESTYNAAMLF